MPRRTKQMFYPRDRASSKLIDFRRRDIICTSSDYDQKKLLTLPYIQLVEWELTTSPLVEQLAYASTQIKYAIDEKAGPAKGKAYNGVYIGKPTGFTYVLPYTTEYHHQITQNWSEMDGTGISLFDDFQKIYTGLQKLSQPAGAWIYPKAYTGANENSFTVRFNLVNTVTRGGSTYIDDIGPGSAAVDYMEDTVGKNKRFLERLIQKNLASLSDWLLVVPPSVYEIYIPGIRWSPISSIQGITVANKGTMNNWKNYLVPDAWEVTLQIRELLLESKQLFEEAIKGGTGAEDMDIHVIEEGLEPPPGVPKDPGQG